MDNLQPLLLNDSNDGGDWMEHDVSISKIWKRQSLSALGSEKIGSYIKERLEENVKEGHIREDRKK